MTAHACSMLLEIWRAVERIDQKIILIEDVEIHREQLNCIKQGFLEYLVNNVDSYIG